MPSNTSTEFAGIRNENEFYSHHYLSELFVGDIRKTVKRWNEVAASDPEKPAPHRQLQGLSKSYRLFRSRFEAGRRNAKDRLDLQREWHRTLLRVLGHEWRTANHGLEEGDEVPILSASGTSASGAPALLVLGAFDANAEGDDPLSLTPHIVQFHGEAPPDPEILTETWEEIVTRRIFGQENPPRWLLLLSFGQALLLERGKWTHNRLLRFDLHDILDRREDATLKATAVLLHRESLLPDAGQSLLDRLDENSHRHAFAVSEDLKYAMRESIELIGNEAIRYLRDVSKDKVFNLDEVLAGDLGKECLRYMYRLLFLFYIEAKPELGYAPMDSDAYRKGYSLEHLRDLELVNLTEDDAREGFYFHESISRLFRLIREGFDGRQWGGSEDMFGDGRFLRHGFRIRALDSTLFRTGSTPLLDRVKLRNHILQRVITLMSLSRPAKGRYNRRGRISYAQLGINQLGAVYEALLPYRGFFAEEDLYEVKKAKDKPDVLKGAWFVNAAELENYTEDERVYETDEDGSKRLRMHPKGCFVYRLRGRDRQKSASYYTPESLTRCVVKHSLKELIHDEMSADEILDLTVCEPAMGSAAFLNEAVNQLAESYLARKQREHGQRIPHEEYADELQRAKHFIADRNVYGVDLNPMAVELGEVSLWLNSMHRDGHVPWFGYQLACGNSLVGARRQVYPTKLMEKQKKDGLWFNEAPKRVGPEPSDSSSGVGRPPATVYHFLLPDPGMAAYKNKTAKRLEAVNFAMIAAWRKEFIRFFKQSDIAELERLSDAVDDLWALHAEQLARDHRETEDTLQVWGRRSAVDERHTTNTWKDRIRAQGVFSEGTKTTSPYRRLKLVMDYWCSLWFWPIDRASDLPSRDQFLTEIALVLTGSVWQGDRGPGQIDLLFGDEYAEHAKEISERITNEVGMLDLEQLFANFPRLRLVDEIAAHHRFHHWELAFADVFYGIRPNGGNRGGFDLVLGNPPWIKVEWREREILGEFNPEYEVRKHSASDLTKRVQDEFATRPGLRTAWLTELEGTSATQTFLNAKPNYPLLAGQQTNLYKCFLPQGWIIGSARGVAGFLHPDSVYDDPSGGSLRAALYPRLRAHYQFANEKQLFADTHHHTKFSINVYAPCQVDVMFSHISNLYSAVTVDACLTHDGHGPVPGIKDAESNWNTVGHRHRVVPVGSSVLETFATLYDEPGTPPIQARLGAVHTRSMVGVLRKLAAYPACLGDLGADVGVNYGWHETGAQKDGTTRRKTTFPSSPQDVILSGPHYFCGNPFYKTARRNYSKNSDYDVLDLTTLTESYVPRTNYGRACSTAEYERRTPRAPWIVPGERHPRKVTDYYRVVNRRMVGSTSQRTLQTALLPPGSLHVHTSLSSAFRDQGRCAEFAGLSMSVVLDFFIKSAGTGELNLSWLRCLPIVSETCIPALGTALRLRALSLNCLTRHYANFWRDLHVPAFRTDQWTKADPRLPPKYFADLTPQWSWDTPLRTDYARRQAMVEIDVLSAMALDLTLDELATIYRAQFPVLSHNDRTTWYDTHGRIVFTSSKGLPDVGLPRTKKKGDTAYCLRTPKGDRTDFALGWNNIHDLTEGVVTRTIQDDTLPGGRIERTIEYHAPFDRCDREEDYRTAWAAFEERFHSTDRTKQP